MGDTVGALCANSFDFSYFLSKGGWGFFISSRIEWEEEKRQQQKDRQVFQEVLLLPGRDVGIMQLWEGSSFPAAEQSMAGTVWIPCEGHPACLLRKQPLMFPSSFRIAVCKGSVLIFTQKCGRRKTWESMAVPWTSEFFTLRDSVRAVSSLSLVASGWYGLNWKGARVTALKCLPWNYLGQAPPLSPSSTAGWGLLCTGAALGQQDLPALTSSPQLRALLPLLRLIPFESRAQNIRPVFIFPLN